MFHPNWLGVLAAAGAILLFQFVFQSARKWPAKPRLWALLASVVLAIPGASFAVHYTHLLPESAWYYEFRSWPGTELMMLLVGVAGGIAASILPRVLLILPLLGTTAVAIIPVVKPFVGPIADSHLLDRWRGEVCMQSTPSTCGAASVASLLRRHGIEVTEREVARAAYSYAGGTEAWYLARVVRRNGCQAVFHFSDGLDPEIPLPVMAGVIRFGTLGHFVPIFAIEGDRFEIGDPIQGREVLSREQMLRRYRFTGFYMQVTKAP